MQPDWKKKSGLNYGSNYHIFAERKQVECLLADRGTANLRQFNIVT